MPRYVITGGPGAGKTSLLAALGALRYACSEEASRQLIMEEAAKGSGCLPWTNLTCFAEKALVRMVASWHDAAEQAVTFFDRGIPDINAYLTVAGLPVSANQEEALRRYPYARTVFLLTPWREIYVQDEARWQTFEEAETIGHQLANVYSKSGYEIVELPKCPVDQRVDFIIKRI
ncbi:MAG TPA: AAA family ATPase [Puia sp.]|nr:AAA family ATPase [Puia sp.]